MDQKYVSVVYILVEVMSKSTFVKYKRINIYRKFEKNQHNYCKTKKAGALCASHKFNLHQTLSRHFFFF